MQFTTIESSLHPVPVTPETVSIQVFQGGRSLDRIPMPGQMLTIGRGEFCDIQLDVAEVPLVHSEVICDGGVLRIEASGPETQLEINGRRVVRLALRDGDRIAVGGYTLSIEIGQKQPLETEDSHTPEADYSHLSASELCDLIFAEQAEIDEHELRRNDGLRKLVSAIELTWMADSDEDIADEFVEADTAANDWSEVPAVFVELTSETLLPEQVLEITTPTIPAAMTPVVTKLDDLLLQFQDNDLRASA